MKILSKKKMKIVKQRDIIQRFLFLIQVTYAGQGRIMYKLHVLGFNLTAHLLPEFQVQSLYNHMETMLKSTRGTVLVSPQLATFC